MNWTPRRALFAIGLLGLALVVGYLTLEFVVNPSTGFGDRDYEFYYEHSYFTRSARESVFHKVNLKGTRKGPWLWISETDGFQVDRENAVEIGKRIARQLGLKDPQQYYHVIYIEDSGWSLRLVTSENPDHGGSDGWIDAGRDDAPFTLSITKDGPRISLPCTETELRNAFGKPDAIHRPAPRAGAPGV
jgi:hypothetical protein